MRRLAFIAFLALAACGERREFPDAALAAMTDEQVFRLVLREDLSVADLEAVTDEALRRSREQNERLRRE